MSEKMSYENIVREYSYDILDEDAYRRLRALEQEQALAKQRISRESVGKIAMQGYIYYKDQRGNIYKKNISMVNKDYVMIVKYYDEVEDDFASLELYEVVDRYWWSDYGKTFAATKEELEKEGN